MPTIYSRSRSLARSGYRQAQAMGHDMERIQADVTHGAYVAMCWSCGRYLAVDVMEHDHAYGGVLEGPCAATPAMIMLENGKDGG